MVISGSCFDIRISFVIPISTFEFRRRGRRRPSPEAGTLTGGQRVPPPSSAVWRRRQHVCDSALATPIPLVWACHPDWANCPPTELKRSGENGSGGGPRSSWERHPLTL